MDFSSLTQPRMADLLISFMDIQGFSGMARSLETPLALFEALDGWARLVVAGIEAAGGRVVKFIGDECLVVFTEDAVDEGVRALIDVKAKAEAYLAARGFPTKMRVTAHFGAVAVGPFGAGGCRLIDVLGDTINVAASLGRGEHRGRLVISPQAFRKLSPATRKGFHKYTPPIVYMAE
jgi:adenylate cyclase